MLFDPGGVPHTCPLAVYGIVLSDLSTSSATPEMALTRLNHFSHKAYGLQPPCLRLTYAVTDASPRLSMECAGSALFQSHFQRLVDRHFVAHRKCTLSLIPKVTDDVNQAPQEHVQYDLSLPFLYRESAAICEHTLCVCLHQQSASQTLQRNYHQCNRLNYL